MRIVVEHQNPLVAADIARDLQDAGHTVVTCRGPSLRGDRACPVTDDRPCPLVDDADVVLAGLPSEQLGVYVALRDRYAMPVVLILSRSERERLPVLEQVGPWVPRALGGPKLAQALEAAARGGA